MSEYECAECGTAIEVGDEWESIRNESVLTCPKCNTALTLDYDEPYDEETGEGDGYFFLEKVAK